MPSVTVGIKPEGFTDGENVLSDLQLGRVAPGDG